MMYIISIIIYANIISTHACKLFFFNTQQARQFGIIYNQ